jgi:hypothetical protein
MQPPGTRLPCSLCLCICLSTWLLDFKEPSTNHASIGRAGASLVWFPKGGHGFFWQFPDKAAALINAFLMADA